MDIHSIPQLRDPVALLAFSGWSDAGEAATYAASHFLSVWAKDSSSDAPELIAHVDSEDYFDYQVNRPLVRIDQGQVRELTWPDVRVMSIQTPSLPFDLVVVQGAEPSMRWKQFSKELLDFFDDLEVSMIVTFGSMLSDSPHTRPISISATGSHPDLSARLGVGVSTYQGPTGILGVLLDGAHKRGIDAVSLWAPLPHYASSSPSPKATLALINAFEDLMGVRIPEGELPDLTTRWEESMDMLAEQDSDVASYIKELEENTDASSIPDATGDSIAREFERYLRRQKED
ncbi:unannotated protein [freshwater metagenome]|uniref:Unannotated protein n=1 Tax=freshwater metagenome TaxID=449393 RepID=A0A6J7XU33_9ZZZZ|nr:PAC2 family protein [Actinomycetota bacterium]